MHWSISITSIRQTCQLAQLTVVVVSSRSVELPVSEEQSHDGVDEEVVQSEGYSCWGQPKIIEGLPVPVKMVEISRELLHEMDWQYPKNYEE